MDSGAGDYPLGSIYKGSSETAGGGCKIFLPPKKSFVGEVGNFLSWLRKKIKCQGAKSGACGAKGNCGALDQLQAKNEDCAKTVLSPVRNRGGAVRRK